MKDLEEIFKEKFALDAESATDFEARHPFQNEYWEAAEKLILADERRRRAVWWWLAATAGVLFGGYFLIKNWVAVQPPSEPIVQNQIENFSKNELEKTAASIEQSQNFSGKENSKTALPAEQPQNISIEKTSTAAPTIHNKFTNPTLHQSNEVISKNSPVIVVHDIRKVAGADAKSVSGNDAEVIASTSKSVDSQNFKNEFWAVPMLQTLDFQKFEIEKPQPKKVDFQRIVKKYEPKTWHFGAFAGVQWQPEKNKFGWAAGVFLQKKFTANWSVFTEILLRKRPDTSVAKTSEQVKYDFGVAIKKFDLIRKSAFWLEMPLGFQFSKSEKWAFQFGIAPAALLASRGVLTASEKPSTTFEYRNMASKKVWLDDADYRKFYLSPFLGAELRLNRTFAASLQASFQPQNLELNNETSGLATPKIGVEVGAKINLK